MNVCQSCGKGFGQVNSGGRKARKTCSKTCLSAYMKAKYDAKRVDAVCAICSTTWRVPKAHKSSIATCSRKCHAKYLSQKYKGRKLSKQWIANQNSAKTRVNIVKYGKFRCERCDALFKTNTALRAHKASCSLAGERKRACSFCSKVFAKQSAATLHENVWCKENPASKRASTIEKIKRGQNQSELFLASKRVSAAEQDFCAVLKSIFDDLETGYAVPEINHVYDAYSPAYNVLFEFDGDYWHGNPQRYTLTPKMKRQYHIDKAYTNEAIDKGIRVIRVWDSESNAFLKELKEAAHAGHSSLENFVDQKRSTTDSLRYSDSKES